MRPSCDTEPSGCRQARGRLSWLLSLVAAVVAVVLLLGLLRDRTPALELKALEKAEEVWRRQGIRDYDLVLTISGDARPDQTYETTVRDATVVALRLDGAPLARLPARKEDYSLEGLFQTMRRELEMAGDPRPDSGQRRGAILKASFHPELGLPQVFKAIAPDRQSVAIVVEQVKTPGKGTIYPQGGD